MLCVPACLLERYVAVSAGAEASVLSRVARIRVRARRVTCSCGVQIQNGKGQMPAWEGTLDDEEIEAVGNYVYATAGANAW